MPRVPDPPFPLWRVEGRSGFEIGFETGFETGFKTGFETGFKPEGVLQERVTSNFLFYIPGLEMGVN